MKENLSTAMYVVSEDESITTNYEMEVPAFYVAEKTEPMAVNYEKHDYVEGMHFAEDNHMSDLVVEDSDRDTVDNYEMEDLKKDAENKLETDFIRNNGPKVSDVRVETKEIEIPLSVDEVRLPFTYSEYRLMTISDKVKALGVTEEMSVNDIVKDIRDFYNNCGHAYDFDGLMDEADMIFKVARRDSIYEVAARITQVIQMLYGDYRNMTLGAKATLFDFRMEDANYNLSLHREVLRLFGVNMDMEEMLYDYQQIYEERMLQEKEERCGKDKQIDRGRGR